MRRTENTWLGFSYLDVALQCQLKCFRISYRTSNYYPGRRGSHLGPMSRTPVIPAPLTYPRAHALVLDTSGTCPEGRDLHLGCTYKGIHGDFLLGVHSRGLQQPRCAWSWRTHTSIRRGVKQQNPHFQGGCVCNPRGLRGAYNSVGVGVTQEFGGFVKERCLENFSCVLLLCKHVVLWFICCIANIDSEYMLISH